MLLKLTNILYNKIIRIKILEKLRKYPNILKIESNAMERREIKKK